MTLHITRALKTAHTFLCHSLLLMVLLHLAAFPSHTHKTLLPSRPTSRTPPLWNDFPSLGRIGLFQEPQQSRDACSMLYVALCHPDLHTRPHTGARTLETHSLWQSMEKWKDSPDKQKEAAVLHSKEFQMGLPCTKRTHIHLYFIEDMIIKI